MKDKETYENIQQRQKEAIQKISEISSELQLTNYDLKYVFNVLTNYCIFSKLDDFESNNFPSL